MTVLDALRDPALFGSFFADRATWRAWETFLGSLFGLSLPEDQLTLFRRHSGRQAAPAAPAKEAWVIVGRRGGKSRIAALIAVYLACFRDYKKILARGEVGTLPIVAADRRQARTVMGYVKGLIHGIPMLEQLIMNETAESIELSTGCRIEIHTASWRSIRGYTCVGAVLDEVAFWRSEDSANPDVEIVNALRPAMSTVPDALLVAISSPYARRGILWEQYRRHYGKDGDPVLVWQAPTRAMNPTVPEEVVTEALEQDEAAARSEYLAEFRSDIESFVSREVVDAATVPNRRELPPISEVRYDAFVDPSGGSADAFALAIAHREQRDDESMVILDVVREFRAPFSPEQVVGDCAAILGSYGVSTVTGDRYGGEWPREALRRHGIEYTVADKTKSDLYRDALPLLNSGRVELLDLPRLHSQLVTLERRTSRAGRDTIDHPHGVHDDVANAVAGALVACAAAPGRPFLARPDAIAAIVRDGRQHPFSAFETTVHDGLEIDPSRFDLNVPAARAAHIAVLPSVAALAIGYAKSGVETNGSRQSPTIILEGILRILPAAGGEVVIEDVVALLLRLKELGLPLRYTTASSFGWVGPLVRLRDAGVLTGELVPTDAEPYAALRAAVYERRLEGYEHPLLAEQLAALEADDRTSVPSGRNTELAAAVAGLVHLLVRRRDSWSGERQMPSSPSQATAGSWVPYGSEGDLIEYGDDQAPAQRLILNFGVG